MCELVRKKVEGKKATKKKTSFFLIVLLVTALLLSTVSRDYHCKQAHGKTVFRIERTEIKIKIEKKG